MSAVIEHQWFLYWLIERFPKLAKYRGEIQFGLFLTKILLFLGVLGYLAYALNQ